MTAIAFQNAALLRRLADTANPPESIAALARDLDRDKSNTRRAMVTLEEEGVIDGLALTDKGRQILAGIDVADGAALSPLAPRPSPLAWPLDKIVRNPANRDVDPASIPAMADSLAAQGQLQPITLTPVREDGRRMLLIGERRWLGAKLAAEQGRLPDSLKAGLRFEEREATPAEAIAITVVENVERQEIPPLELAFLLRGYADAAGEDGKPLDAKSVAERLGLGVRDVQDKIRIARQATPEAIAAYREHGSWDRLRDTVTEKKAGAALSPHFKPADGLTAADFGVPTDFRAHQRDLTPEEGRERARHWLDLTSHERHVLPHRPGDKDYGYPRAKIEVARIRESEGWLASGGLSLGGIGHHADLDGVFSADTHAYASREAAIAGGAAIIRDVGGRNLKGGLPKDVETWLIGLTGEPSAGIRQTDDPHVVNGVRYPNLTRANEARRAAGILPNPSNHGSATPKATDSADPVVRSMGEDWDRQRAEVARAEAEAINVDPLGARGRLALVEIAHKTGQQRRPIDPVNPAEWTGDPDLDFVEHGCTCGPHWLDPAVQTLTSIGFARVVQIPGGHPPMLALTGRGADDLQAYGCPLPVGDHDLALQRRIAGAPENLPAGTYVTPALAREAEPAPEPTDADRAASHAAQLVADQPDPWDRAPEEVAEAEALLARVLAFTCEDAEAEPTEGDTAAGLLALLGLRPAAAITDQGGIQLETVEGLQVELVTVDAAGHHPDEYAKALAALVAWAFERAIGGEG